MARVQTLEVLYSIPQRIAIPVQLQSATAVSQSIAVSTCFTVYWLAAVNCWFGPP